MNGLFLSFFCLSFVFRFAQFVEQNLATGLWGAVFTT
jgi:hypothetical protein